MNAELRLRLSVGLLSAAVIGYEIGLTRLFSFLQHYHYTFLVVSGAVCGLGLGAALSAAIRQGTEGLGRHLGWWAAFCASSMGLGALLLATFPRMPLLLMVAVAGVPFIAAGAFLALVFRIRHTESQRLYCWDLVGAALGILWIVVALEWLGGVAALISAGMLALAASVLLAERLLARLTMLGLLVVLVVALLLARDGAIDLRALAEAADKPMFRALGSGRNGRNTSEVVDTRWSAFARTDLVDRSGDTGLNLYVDGGAGSYMFRFPGDYRRLFFLRREAAFFPYYFGKRERALIIGPGGGADVLYALMTGWRDIEAVEINPEIVDLVRERGDYNGHLYDLQGVDVHTGDGRNYLQRSDRRYDLIALPLVYAEAADLVGYALAENYLFTREAFAAYLDHLDEGGRLALVVHNHALMLRVVATLEALSLERGGEPGRILDHLVVVNGTRGDATSEEAYRPLLLVQKKPYTAYQLGELRHVMAELELNAYFLPGLRERSAFAPLRTAGLAAFVAATEFDLSPVTDDRPFFYDAIPGLDVKLVWLLLGSGFLGVLALLAPLAFGAMRERRLGELPPLLWAFFAAGLGAGFMMVEIHLLQRFGLFLGYPTLTLAVALFALLIGTGAGSLVGSRLGLLARPSGLGLFAVGVGVIYGVYGLLLTSALDWAFAWSLSARVGLTLVLVAPLGMLLGTCFPACLRLGGLQHSGIVPWLWTVNGFFSVLGSVGSVALGMEWGAEAALGVGAAIYMLAGAVLFLRGRGAVAVADVDSVVESGRWTIALLLLLALCWYVAFSFIGAQSSDSALSARYPRPAIAEEVWPESLGTF